MVCTTNTAERQEERSKAEFCLGWRRGCPLQGGSKDAQDRIEPERIRGTTVTFYGSSARISQGVLVGCVLLHPYLLAAINRDFFPA